MTTLFFLTLLLNMFIPDDIKKCIVFIGIDHPSGRAEKSWRGTGFFVDLPSKIPGKSFLFLVTAKHVTTAISGKTFYIRANAKDGHSFTFRNDGGMPWWFHPSDSSADVAIFPLSIPPDVMAKIDYKSISSHMLLNEKERQTLGIGEGTETYIVGLFSRHAGNAKNIPIIRTGSIAMLPDETVPTKDFGSMEAYLIESRSIGGLSGSPVFAVEHVDPIHAKLHLIGLIHGHWDVNPDAIIDSTTADSGAKAGVNMGIAIVTPAKKILETIQQEELVASRQRTEIKWNAGTSQDSNGTH